MTEAIVGVMVNQSMTEGEFEMTTSKPAAQHLRDILEHRQEQPFEGSGSSDHCDRRNLWLPVIAAIVLLVILLALLIL